MEQFIRDHGVWAVLVWAVVENDVVFIMTGVAIDLGLIPAVPGLLAAVCGGVIHDSFWFGLARHRSEWIRSTVVYRKVGPYVERLVHRFGVWELFFCRFVYGTRNPSLIFWGVQRLPIQKFISVNALGLLVWCGILSGLGYFLSDRAVAIIGQVKRMERWLLCALALALVFLALERFLSKRRIRRAQRADAVKDVAAQSKEL
jgi:membrane protein DedA with SNARE-associated domain